MAYSQSLPRSDFQSEILSYSLSKPRKILVIPSKLTTGPRRHLDSSILAPASLALQEYVSFTCLKPMLVIHVGGLIVIMEESHFSALTGQLERRR